MSLWMGNWGHNPYTWSYKLTFKKGKGSTLKYFTLKENNNQALPNILPLNLPTEILFLYITSLENSW